MIQRLTKKCSRCSHEKPLSAFNKCTAEEDGKQRYCRVCQIETRRLYLQTEAGKEQRKKADRKYRATITGKQRVSARNTVHYAIRHGNLEPAHLLSCKCGKPADEYHHPSYKKADWLNVQALCKECHVTIHRIERLNYDTAR